MNSKRYCLFCNKEFEGRTDKKFCDPYCKSSYHYNQRQKRAGSFYSMVDHQLKVNRRILNKFNKAGKAVVRSEVLTDLGFNPKYFTHYWKNNKGDVYLFVYEFGFISRIENGRKKYVLIKWQDYMNS